MKKIDVGDFITYLGNDLKKLIPFLELFNISFILKVCILHELFELQEKEFYDRLEIFDAQYCCVFLLHVFLEGSEGKVLDVVPVSGFKEAEEEDFCKIILEFLSVFLILMADHFRFAWLFFL